MHAQDVKAQLTGSNILPYILAGKAIFTVRNPISGKSFTYKVSQPKDCSKWFVKVLTGADNNSDYSYIGFLNERKEFVYGRGKSRIADGAPSVLAFGWFMAHIKNLGPVEVYQSGHCARCGRLLTVSTSVLNGLGPECVKKIAA